MHGRLGGIGITLVSSGIFFRKVILMSIKIVHLICTKCFFVEEQSQSAKEKVVPESVNSTKMYAGGKYLFDGAPDE